MPDSDRDKLMHSDGTTALETVCLIIPSIFSVYINSALITLLSLKRKWRFLFEFVTLLMPMILGVTILSDFVFIIICTVLIVNILLYFLIRKRYVVSTLEFLDDKSRRIPFITNARATINILSVIAILAVDFQVFPRRFAKTSTFGYSLMDLGVGLYIFANSIVSPECLNKKDSITKIIKSCIPLFIIGLFRLMITKQTDYHVPVAEYGIHWNFFFTLLFTKCLSSLIVKITHVKYMNLFSILILFLHEILLQTVLQEIVMKDNPRTNFFLANKEGISSILGYVSLYLFAVYFGHILNEKVYNSLRLKENLKLFLSYLVVTGLLAYLLNGKFGTSRRLINSSYCLWVVFVGIFAALLFYLGEIIQKYAFGKKSNFVKSPYIYQAVNFNALIFFLLGNLLTGIINVLWDTLLVDNKTALGILFSYLFVITRIMCLLYDNNFKLKV